MLFRSIDSQKRKEDIERLEEALKILNKIKNDEYSKLTEDCSIFLTILYQKENLHDKIPLLLEKQIDFLGEQSKRIIWLALNFFIKSKNKQKMEDFIDKLSKIKIEENNNKLFYYSQILRSISLFNIEEKKYSNDLENMILKQYLLAPQPHSIFIIGKYYYKREEYLKSFVFLKESIESFPRDMEVNFFNALAYARLGNFSKDITKGAHCQERAIILLKQCAKYGYIKSPYKLKRYLELKIIIDKDSNIKRIFDN